MPIPVFVTAAERLRIVARQATPGPYLRSQQVPGALRCADDAEGERHIGFGIAKEDCRLLVGADPEAFELLAAALEQAAATDEGVPALAEYVTYLGKKMGLKLPPVDLAGPAAIVETPAPPADHAPPVAPPRQQDPEPTPAAAPAPTAPPAAVFDAADL